jgi:hypothetical protein
MMNGVYGGNGVYSRQIVTNPNVVELPMAPISQRPVTVQQHPCVINWRTMGIILSLLAAATLALGVADVVYTYQTYMVGMSCATNGATQCNQNVLVFTWIAVGIWASIPVFIYGLFLICHSGSAATTRPMCVELLVFLCTFVFTPAMVVISSIEVWKGVGIYYWTASSPLTSDDTVKAGLPIAIAVLGFIEWFICAIALYYLCCCQHTVAETTTAACPPQPVVVTTPTYERPACQPCAALQPIPAPVPVPSCQPCAARPPTFYSAGGMGGGLGGGCSVCPRPTSYNNFGQMSPNPAYSYYRS